MGWSACKRRPAPTAAGSDVPGDRQFRRRGGNRFALVFWGMGPQYQDARERAGKGRCAHAGRGRGAWCTHSRWECRGCAPCRTWPVVCGGVGRETAPAGSSLPAAWVSPPSPPLRATLPDEQPRPPPDRRRRFSNCSFYAVSAQAVCPAVSLRQGRCFLTPSSLSQGQAR